MATKMGVREFRDSFTTIAREATEPVIVTNHDKVVGWFTPANRPAHSIREILATLEDVRNRVEARGVEVGRRMKELGLEDEALFEDPWTEARPTKTKHK
jgi:antitoxin (DNA-binding transcriptional repressor) of toxin-antitoxin stability system